MDKRKPRYNYPILVAVVILGLAYSAWMSIQGSITGQRIVDGSMGIVIGLLVCSRPAAHAVDLLFANRFALSTLVADWKGICWLAANIAALFVGWGVITVGATRLVDQGG
jgi:hypothetical protein